MSRGRFYLRCESAEWDFIRELVEPVPFDAAIISDRYIADYPPGHSRFGEPRDRLVQSLAAQNVYWSVDPDTARLGHPKSAERQRPHAANRPLAQALPLPLTTERLSSQDAIDALVDAGAQHQLTSRASAAPYLETEGIEDPRFGIDLRLLERSAELAGDRTLIAYLQVLGRDLRSGHARAVAKHLAAAGAEVIMIRVRRFEAERASTEDVLAYAATIDAGARAGARVVADCVGRLGPVLVAAGADGFATNAKNLRVVPADLHPPGGGGGAGELLGRCQRRAKGGAPRMHRRATHALSPIVRRRMAPATIMHRYGYTTSTSFSEQLDKPQPRGSPTPPSSLRVAHRSYENGAARFRSSRAARPEPRSTRRASGPSARRWPPK